MTSKRVVEYLRDNGKLTDSAALVGFGDATGDPARAALLSKLRAMTVRRELNKRGVFLKEINGMGSELPVASNDAGSGRVKNRRVEVWSTSSARSYRRPATGVLSRCRRRV